MPTTKTRAKMVAKVSLVPDRPAAPITPKRADSKAVHAMLDDLFVALKPFGACESPDIVRRFHALKTST